jgi:formylmethanofuran dehydrogenase subunit E-like metal-binding protein
MNKLSIMANCIFDNKNEENHYFDECNYNSTNPLLISNSPIHPYACAAIVKYGSELSWGKVFFEDYRLTVHQRFEFYQKYPNEMCMVKDELVEAIKERIEFNTIEEELICAQLEEEGNINKLYSYMKDAA